MPKDYVNRPRPTRKKAPARSPGRAGRTPPPAKPKWPKLVIVALLVGGFASLLWWMQSTADKLPDEPAPQAQPKPTPQQRKDPLPPKPEEEWRFIEELENKTVEVDVPEQPESEGPYVMQCGSFHSAEQAEAMKAKIAFAGLESQVRATEGKNGLWYRVILGPYERKRRAESDRHKIQRAQINTCRIWKWQ